DIAATPEELEAMGRELDLQSFDRLTGSVSLSAGRNGSIEITGSMAADLVQTCVVSLDPVPQQIRQPLHREFVLDAGRDESDTVDVFDGHNIDLGAVIWETLALSIDPYPRAPGAKL